MRSPTQTCGPAPPARILRPQTLPTLALLALLTSPNACSKGGDCECPAPGATGTLASASGAPGDTVLTARTPPASPPAGTTATPGGVAVPNTCGGSYPLAIPPGWPCGTANQGTTVCGGPNATVCREPQLYALCHTEGGDPAEAITVVADDLPDHFEHGDYFGPCVPTESPADGGDHVRPETVAEPLEPRNSCGGTGSLEQEPGDACGTLELGVCECDGPDHVACREPSHVTLCHRPPGNPENAHTLTVGASAVEAHLGHGDSVGACPRDDGHGRGGGRRHGGQGREDRAGDGDRADDDWDHSGAHTDDLRRTGHGHGGWGWGHGGH